MLLWSLGQLPLGLFHILHGWLGNQHSTPTPCLGWHPLDVQVFASEVWCSLIMHSPNVNILQSPFQWFYNKWEANCCPWVRCPTASHRAGGRGRVLVLVEKPFGISNLQQGIYIMFLHPHCASNVDEMVLMCTNNNLCAYTGISFVRT